MTLLLRRGYDGLSCLSTWRRLALSTVAPPFTGRLVSRAIASTSFRAARRNTGSLESSPDPPSTSISPVPSSISPFPSSRHDVRPQHLPAGQTSPPSITLRPYQESAIDACLSAVDSGLKRIGVSSPTGSGKTFMFMNLIPRFPPVRSDQNREKAERVLIVVSSVELASQTEVAAERWLGMGWSVEVEQSKRIASGRADVLVSTV